MIPGENKHNGIACFYLIYRIIMGANCKRKGERASLEKKNSRKNLIPERESDFSFFLMYIIYEVKNAKRYFLETILLH